MHFEVMIFSLCLATFVSKAQETTLEITPAATPPATYSRAHIDQPYIAMTFDDGPSAANTPRLLDILKRRGIKATFFLIGENAQAHPEIVKQILAEGHEIRNHTWTHPQLSKLSDDRVKFEISKTQNVIKDINGYTPTLLRPPYGAITQKQREWIARALGLNVILWSVNPFDWKRPGPAVVRQRILAGAAPGAIILSHDIHKQTVDAMPTTLDALIAKGYKFVTVSQIIALDKPEPSPTRQSCHRRRPLLATVSRTIRGWLTPFSTIRPPENWTRISTKKPATYSRTHVDQPYIAMTFDDGPSAANTPRLLDMLKQREIKATFFLIGENVQAYPEIVKRILAERHEIGNHTWTHPHLSRLGHDRVKSEISWTQNAIKDISGYTPTLLRPPYGAITRKQREWIARALGLNVILWSVDPFDWKRPGPAVVRQRILAGAAPGAIILSHDIHKQTVDAMPTTLDALIAKGYKFVTVSQMIALDKPKPSLSPISAGNGTEYHPRLVNTSQVQSTPTAGKPESHLHGATRPNLLSIDGA